MFEVPMFEVPMYTIQTSAIAIARNRLNYPRLLHWSLVEIDMNKVPMFEGASGAEVQTNKYDYKLPGRTCEISWGCFNPFQ